MTSPFFGTSIRRDPSQPARLAARIDAEVRDRIEEAVDFVCLDVMVQARRGRGVPAPAADSAADRAEFEADVTAFLERLERDLTAAVAIERRVALTAAGRAASEPRACAFAVQVALAKELPDYWPRFDETRERHAAERLAGAVSSGGERRGLLGRLFGL
ncbi:MAG: hypothetical protein HYR86_04785 [Candidatus Rokubacteria bacterium]|nr:hypothetical protein [Candidatus Rokubacteria bacterium]